MHHLIDPRTQRPAASDVHSASVVGPSARLCEIHAKVALILGSEAGARHLEALGLEGLLVRQDGSVRTIGSCCGVM